MNKLIIKITENITQEYEIPDFFDSIALKDEFGTHLICVLQKTSWIDKAVLIEALEKVSKIDFVAEYPENKAGMIRIDNSEFVKKLKEELGLNEVEK
jgi:hypothetical protein